MSEQSTFQKVGSILDSVGQASRIQRWSRSSKDFAYGAPLITADELNEKALTPFPDRDDVRWILDQFDSGRDLIIWKSRQHFASHALHGSSLWLAAFKKFRSIGYVAQEEQEGKDHIEERVLGMWERLPKFFTQQYKWNFKGGIFILEERGGEAWRSYIEPIARGSRKTRSWTYSRLIFDEAAHNDLLKSSFIGAYATVRGSRDPKTGLIKKGQVILQSSAAYNEFMIDQSGVMLEQGLELARAS